MATSITDFEILRTGQTEKLSIFVRDPSTDVLTDVVGASGSDFSLIDISDDSVKVSQAFGRTGSALVTHPAAGTYQYNFNATTYPQEYLATFRCLMQGEVLQYNVFVKSVRSKNFAYAAALRLQVDKARKSINDQIENIDKPTLQPAIPLLFGYADKNLIYFLERGIQFINSVPPYTGFTVDTFPFNQYGTILIDAATIAALESQGIFAIDTDYSYSLGGNSLVIDHFTKLSSFLSMLLSRFDKSLVSFKQQFRSKGLIVYQFMPGGVRSQRMLNAQPSGYWSRMLSSAFV
jgi:hypothetical protein